MRPAIAVGYIRDRIIPLIRVGHQISLKSLEVVFRILTGPSGLVLEKNDRRGPFLIDFPADAAINPHPRLGRRQSIVLLQHLDFCLIRCNHVTFQKLFLHPLIKGKQMLFCGFQYPVAQSCPAYPDSLIAPVFFLAGKGHCIDISLVHHMGYRRRRGKTMLYHRLRNV